MDEVRPCRPRLLAPTLTALAWHAITWPGLALVLLAWTSLSRADWEAMGVPLAVMAVIVVVSELTPILATRLVGDPVSLTPVFVFAALYVWGPYPALLMMAAAVTFSEILARKAPWKSLFNVAQYCLSVAAGWMVLSLSGVTPTPVDPMGGLTARDLGWVAASWAAYHLTNLALVACLAPAVGQTWRDSFLEDFWLYTISTLSLLATAPMVAISVVAGPDSWALMPLLLAPLVAIQRTEQMSRDREFQALHDPLTGLPNRALLNDRLQGALDRSGRSDGTVVVIMLDLDEFKVVNDGLGHDAGDVLLVAVARRISGAIRRGDTLARFGGDEFAIVSEAVPDRDVPVLAERILDSLSAPFAYAGREVTVTASVGVAVATDSASAQTMLRDADAAMYRAKATGRDRVVHFRQTMYEQAAGRLDQQAMLRRAIERDELRLHYQPVIDLATGRTVGVEALARWQHPERGLLGPGEFIPLAEETGLILPLGTWVLERALHQLAEWRHGGGDVDEVWVAVNLSARQMRDPRLVDRVAQALHRTGVPPRCLHLEITETVVMESVDTAIETLERLRMIGVHISVDDFGTGYSSLAYLKRLPVSTLKIDRSFVDGLGTDASDRSIVDAIVNLARSLDLAVVAEGVETLHQVRILRELGVDTGQGYLWSFPLPAEDVESWIGTASVAWVTDIARAM